LLGGGWRRPFGVSVVLSEIAGVSFRGHLNGKPAGMRQRGRPNSVGICPLV